MSVRYIFKVLSSVCVIFAAMHTASAQTYGQYSPYSIYGVGELAQPGSAYSRTMAGVGIAGRDNRYLNVLNPAAVTARDSLAVMMDFSLYVDNKMFTQNSMKSAFNTGNIGSLAISFPIWRSSAMAFGIAPYSGTGYGYNYSYSDPSVIGHTGEIKYTAVGQGALYQAFAGAGVTFFNRISLGAQAIYYFGSNSKEYTASFTDASYSGIYNGQSMSLKAFGGKFGLQYEQPVGNSVIGVGATYSLSSKLRGYLEDFSYSTASAANDTLFFRRDTLTAASSKVRLASEIGAGISFRHSDRFMMEFNYVYSDWSSAGFGNYPAFRGNMETKDGYSSFTSCASHVFRLGFEFVPNRTDIRYYFNKVSYRGGLYYKEDYFRVDGHAVNAYGLTLGVTLPINKRYNSISLGVELGQRGSTANNLIRESYINFTAGINIFDIWFQKNQYR